MRRAALILAVGLLGAPALADDMSGMKRGQAPADRAFATSMQKMMTDMDAKPTGDADKDFVNMMLPHHEGAVDMANIELKYGKDPALRRLAAAIVAAQEKEIAMMKDWRRRHDK